MARPPKSRRLPNDYEDQNEVRAQAQAAALKAGVLACMKRRENRQGRNLLKRKIVKSCDGGDPVKIQKSHNVEKYSAEELASDDGSTEAPGDTTVGLANGSDSEAEIFEGIRYLEEKLGWGGTEPKKRRVDEIGSDELELETWADRILTDSGLGKKWKLHSCDITTKETIKSEPLDMPNESDGKFAEVRAYRPPALRTLKPTGVPTNANPEETILGLLNRVSEGNLDHVVPQAVRTFNTVSSAENNSNFQAAVDALVHTSINSTIRNPNCPGHIIVTHLTMILAVASGVSPLIFTSYVKGLKSAFCLQNCIASEASPIGHKCNSHVILAISFLHYVGIITDAAIFETLDSIMAAYATERGKCLADLVGFVGPTLRAQSPARFDLFAKSAKKWIHKDTESRTVECELTALQRWVINLLESALTKNARQRVSVLDKWKYLREWLLKNPSWKSGADTRIQFSRCFLDIGDIKGIIPEATVVEYFPSCNPISDSRRSQMLEAAKQLKLHSDVHRESFVAIVTSPSILVTVDRLSKIIAGGKKSHARGAVFEVILRLLNREKQYNRYYAELSAKLCKRKVLKFSMALRNGLAVHLGLLTSYETARIEHLALFYTDLIDADVLSLGTLGTCRTSDWTAPEEKLTVFLVKLCKALCNIAMARGSVVRLTEALTRINDLRDFKLALANIFFSLQKKKKKDSRVELFKFNYRWHIEDRT